MAESKKSPASHSSVAQENPSTEMNPQSESPMSSLCTLTSLAIEMITEIMQYIDILDVLRVRKTCKILAGVSRSHILWARLALSYLSRSPRLHYAERPVNAYNAYELERLCVRWECAAGNWLSKASLRNRERATEIPKFDQMPFLIPGGRWLLVGNRYDGSMEYHDLNSTDPDTNGHPLIAPQNANRAVSCLISDPDMDTTSPSLAFNIAFAIPKLGSRPVSIQIWRVTLVLDDAGACTGLQACCLASRRLHPSEEMVDRISLRNSRLAVSYPTVQDNLILEDNPVTQIAYIDWEREPADKEEYDYPRRNVPYWLEFLWLLPNNQVIGFGEIVDDVDYRYDWIEINEQTYEPELCDSYMDMECSLSLPQGIYGLSPPFIFQDSVRLVLNMGDSIYGVELPTNNSEHRLSGRLQEYKLADIPESMDTFDIVLGYEHAVTIESGTCDLVTFSYSWPQCKCRKTNDMIDNTSNSSVRIYQYPPNVRKPAHMILMDEGSGRIVEMNGGQQRVCDFSATELSTPFPK